MFTTIETQDRDIRIVHTSSLVDVYVTSTASRTKTSVAFLCPGAGTGTGVATISDIADMKQHRDLADALAFARSRMLALRAAEEGQAKP
jgi:hypothetical protein